jgi:hypothetical protein
MMEVITRCGCQGFPLLDEFEVNVKYAPFITIITDLLFPSTPSVSLSLFAVLPAVRLPIFEVLTRCQNFQER